jgi:hypothetical protein
LQQSAPADYHSRPIKGADADGGPEGVFRIAATRHCESKHCKSFSGFSAVIETRLLYPECGRRTEGNDLQISDSQLRRKGYKVNMLLSWSLGQNGVIEV